MPTDDFQIIQELFTPNITINQLLNRYSKDKYKQLYLINSIWCMMRRNIIKVDLFKKLSMNTELQELRDYDEELYQNHLSGKIFKGYLL